jgi:hypothetical protein
MASGDTVYSASGFAVLSNGEDQAGGQQWKVSLNKGGTTSSTRVNVELQAFVAIPSNSPFDVTKQYEVIVKEV